MDFSKTAVVHPQEVLTDVILSGRDPLFRKLNFASVDACVGNASTLISFSFHVISANAEAPARRKSATRFIATSLTSLSSRANKRPNAQNAQIHPPDNHEPCKTLRRHW